MNDASFIPYGQQWIDDQDIQAVTEVLKGDWLTQGPTVAAFESAVADYCGVEFAVAVSSGTAALHAAYVAAGIGPGDEVIMSPLTFSATASAVVFCGGKPVFVDINSDTLTIDPARIEQAITPRTKAIASVDFAGHPCQYNVINEIARRKHLLVVDDACHALGSTYQGKRSGSWADLTALSFHPVKHITTGEGGMVLTNNPLWNERMRNFRHHGIEKKPEMGAWYYEIDAIGNNYRLTDLQCALGLSQLKKLPAFIARRRAIVQRYNEAFATLPGVILPKELHEVESSYHLYIIQLSGEIDDHRRSAVFAALRDRGIGAQVHYMPLHLQPYYARALGYHPGDFPLAESYYQRAITLPLYPKMTDEQVERVIAVVREVLAP